MSEAPPAAELREGLMRQLDSIAGRGIAGWKVGLTSGQARDSMGPGFRPFGFVLRDRVFQSGSVLPLGEFERVGVENELCLRLAAPLGEGATRQAALDAVEYAAPAFEINEPRLDRTASPTERLADNLSQWGIVVGEPWRAWREDGVAESLVDVRLARDGEHVQTVAAQGHIDDHFESLAALARQLARFDRRLEAGDLVITGSYTRAPVTGPGCWTGDFGARIGSVSVEFS